MFRANPNEFSGYVDAAVNGDALADVAGTGELVRIDRLGN
jgi:hypothetical protein